MFPCLPPQNSLDIGVRYEEHSSKPSASIALGSKSPNFYDLRFVQFGGMYFIATWLCAMFAFIKAVIGWRIPTEIGQKTIIRNTVVMTSLHPGRAGTDKGNKNKLMNSDKTPFFHIIKTNVWITILGFYAFQYSLRFLVHLPSRFVSLTCGCRLLPKRPHSPMGAYFIARKPWNCFPNFNHIAFISRLADDAITFYGLETQAGG